MSDDPNAREEGFYWVVLGQNPPEIAYWERGEWWLAGDAKPARARHAWLQAKAASDERRLLLTRTKGFLGRERACRRGSSISAKKALI